MPGKSIFCSGCLEDKSYVEFTHNKAKRVDVFTREVSWMCDGCCCDQKFEFEPVIRKHAINKSHKKLLLKYKMLGFHNKERGLMPKIWEEPKVSPIKIDKKML